MEYCLNDFKIPQIYFIFICCSLLSYKNKEEKEILFLISLSVGFFISITILKLFSELST